MRRSLPGKAQSLRRANFENKKIVLLIPVSSGKSISVFSSAGRTARSWLATPMWMHARTLLPNQHTTKTAPPRPYAFAPEQISMIWLVILACRTRL